MIILCLSLLLLHTVNGIRVTRRDCELSGQCRNCGDGRYSYYRCSSQTDCFPGENCGGTGFCCPNSASFPLVAASFQAPSQSVKGEKTCGDGSRARGDCERDEQCPLRHLCVEGSCCPECSLRREQVMQELPSNDITDVILPQCESSGRLYRTRQCTPSSSRCICVSPFGSPRPSLSPFLDCSTRRQQQSLFPSPSKLRQELESMMREICEESEEKTGECPVNGGGGEECVCDVNCKGEERCCEGKGGGKTCVQPVTPTREVPTNNTSRITITFSENSIVSRYACGDGEIRTTCASPCQASCDNLNAIHCAPFDCTSGCHCSPGFVRRDSMPSSPCIPRQLCPTFDASSHCADPRRQYLTCGSACPISCESRTSPRCIERCVSGCFCRIPYILENINDPLHSRCILPAECPMSSFPPLSPLPPGPITIIHTTPTQPPPLPSPQVFHHSVSKRCSDPLKNYLTCGSSCPPSCSSSSSFSCSNTCTEGCFCRTPYILVDGPDSPCILPPLCPPKEKKACPDPRMEWSQCGANQCARSCHHPQGACLTGECRAGCVCREPYVLSDPADPNPRCILPEECANCEDSRKEFLRCGSSCPVGCDNRHPKSCTPCQSGCFCKNGFVFSNSSDWRNSECIPMEDCPSSPSAVSTSTAPPVPSSTTTTTTTSTRPPTSPPNLARHAAKNTDEELVVTTSTFSVCPTKTSDVGGTECNFHTDCHDGQLCCRSLILPLNSSPQRCTCPDPNSAWSPCGSLCPDYCGSPSPPVCSSTCNAGCACLPGFIRARNDVKAPCVRREECPGVIRDSPQLSALSDPFLPQQVAIANLGYSTSSVRGRIAFYQLSSHTLRIHGIVENLPIGPHAVIIHHFGDTSMNCTRLGPLLVTGSSTSGLLGDIRGEEGGSEFVRLVEWSINDIVGRSVGIYYESTVEWTLRSKEKAPLACGAIGLTRR